MSEFDKLKAKRKAALIEEEKKFNKEFHKEQNDFSVLATESRRVAEVAAESERIIADLDREFAAYTGLDIEDLAFLFLAVGLQCTRIFLINKLTEIEKAGEGKKEDALHDFQKKLLGKLDNGEEQAARNYYAPLAQIISTDGVPYDATQYSEYFNNENKLFARANHRFATLGHDPVIGLLIGTSNILTNTITCVDKPMLSSKISMPFITTNHVLYDENFKHPQIGRLGSFAVMLKYVTDRVEDDCASIVAALIKQMIHIGTDLYTPCGIQIPGANLVLSRKRVEELTKFVNTGDILKAGVSAKLAQLLNVLISTIHGLLYNENRHGSMELYSVKTRKIIMYSNLIATSSNVILVGANTIETGNLLSLRDLDIGGLIVTINRLINDKKFIDQVKEEYLTSSYAKKIMGNEDIYEGILF